MSPPLNESERDEEFENFLRRRSPMHRRLSDFDDAQPSVELDRVVLNRAREAIETPKQPAMFRGSRWAMPLGLAATILIAFTLLLNVEHSPRKVAAAQSTAVANAPQMSPAEAERADSASAELADSASAAARAAPPSPAASLPTSMAREAKRAAVAGDHAEASVPVPSAPPAVAGNAAVAPSAAMESKTEAAADTESPAHADADSWLREIERLRAAGRNADAEREWVAFRRAFPSHSGASVAQPPTR